MLETARKQYQMKDKGVKLSSIQKNPSNPRFIKDDRFKKLVKSLEEFPEMMKLRPIIINKNAVILGGNQRYEALKQIGYKEIPETWVQKAEDLTEAQQREFIIKDNVGFGQHDWDKLANEWNTEDLVDWGLDVPNFENDVDYSVLDDDDVSSEIDGMKDGVKRAIQIEFESEHYDEAYELVKFFRNKGGDVGLIILEHLRAEKKKL